MINSIKIKGYRTFAEFSMAGLVRLNLFVGRNTSGKTSLLEALALLSAGVDLSMLWQVLDRRGEQGFPETSPGRGYQQEVDVTHLFTGHVLVAGSELSVVATNQKPGRTFRLHISEAKPEDNPPLFHMLSTQDPAGPGWSMKLAASQIVNLPVIPLTRRGTLRNDVFNQALNLLRVHRAASAETVQFVTTDSLNAGQLQQLWNEVSLTKEEDLVIRALQFIDPNIERVAPIASPFIGSRGGFLVRRKGEERIPIGSLCECLWRMFALAVALSRAKNGVLLVDEIDTGFHYTVMDDMWKFVNQVSAEFNVQVFATTHSNDCIDSLARVCRDVEDSEGQISLHRIESGKPHSVPLSEAEIKIASERRIEFR